MPRDFDPKHDEAAALQALAREQMISRLLRDVKFDITVCELEGWDCKEYVKRIRDEMNRILEEAK